jgi:hypothetical protein
MGHQFYERLAGRNADAFRFELERDAPDLASAAGFASKLVHNRATKLLAAGDLDRAVRAVGVVLATVAAGASALERRLKLLAALPPDCRYKDETTHVAFRLLDRAAAGSGCAIEDGLRAAVSFFAAQICHVEGVQRLPLDGLLTMQDLVRGLAIRVDVRVAERLVAYHRKDPNGWRTNTWRAPRTGAKRPSIEELEDDTRL